MRGNLVTTEYIKLRLEMDAESDYSSDRDRS